MKKIKITLVLVAGMMFSFLGFAQDLKTEITVDFKIRNLGFKVDGLFNKALITTNFTSQDISQWILYGSVEVNSIDTDNKKRDTHLLKEDFFDINTYPQITLEATNFRKVSETKYDVTVSLTIKETTKIIIIPIEMIGDANRFKLRCNFEINRRDYDVGGSSLILSNIVEIMVNYALKS